jgi:flavorubredoxin
MKILPAHFLHSPGNFQVYDPISHILYSGDLGASIGTDLRVVEDFDAHVRYMDGFHRRYMASNRALKAWAAMVRRLDIETIAPQHGALFRGKPMVERFISWCEGLPCGVDLIDELYPPAGG